MNHNSNWYKIAQITEQHPNLEMFQEATSIFDYDELLQNPQELINYDDIESIQMVYMSPEEYINKIYRIARFIVISFKQ